MAQASTGQSTGLDQTAAGVVETGLVPEDLAMSSADRHILRGLAEDVAQIAASPTMAATRDLWKKHNGLERTRPLVFCDPENGWNEIITEADMRCTGKLARRWEMSLRKEIFWGREMGDDKPVEPTFNVPYTVSPDDWGVEITYHKTESAGSYIWDNPIKDYEKDLPKLHSPTFELDWTTTRGCLDIAQDVFDKILTVRLKGTWWWSVGLTWKAATFRGLENVLVDFIAEPDGLKELLSIISQGLMDKLDYLEANGLLSQNNDGTYVGSGGFGFTDELPQPDFDERVRCIDMWGFGESQETTNVSPRMYEEFIFPYEKPLLDRFGLNCYGCCEPLQQRWHVVKRHPNLRRVSCSPWTDVAQMAGFLQDDYIFSMKPHPITIATPNINRGAIRHILRQNLELTRDCVVEVIMKDNHTIGGRPQNVVEWCQIAREEAQRISDLYY